MTLKQICEKYGKVGFKDCETPVHWIVEIHSTFCMCTTEDCYGPFEVVFMDDCDRYEPVFA